MTIEQKLRDAFDRGLAQGGNLTDELSLLGDIQIESPVEAQAVVDAMAKFVERPVDEDDFGAVFRSLSALFLSVSTAQAFRYLVVSGIPLLIEAYDARLSRVDEFQGDLMYTLKVFARYGTEDALDRVVTAASHPQLSEDFLWSIIFEQLGDEDPIIPKLIDRLSNPLPKGFVCVALLDWINRLMRDDVIVKHPFNTQDGVAILQGWLASSDEDDFSRAHAAAAAIPFISGQHRESLLAQAMDHPDVLVQMEAAWASARLGSAGGEKFLARMCLDVDHSVTARRYLEELGLSQSIPEEADEPEFRAMAKACHWLADPREFGRAPDDIEVYDTRELHWPPTDDWRPVWLFRYSYLSDEPNEPDESGIIMVGGITFSLDDEVADDMPPEDIYALHCCWELSERGDERAPQVRSIEAGRALLAAAPQEPPDPFEDF